jgi:hypothetical protein
VDYIIQNNDDDDVDDVDNNYNDDEDNDCHMTMVIIIRETKIGDIFIFNSFFLLQSKSAHHKAPLPIKPTLSPFSH